MTHEKLGCHFRRIQSFEELLPRFPHRSGLPPQSVQGTHTGCYQLEPADQLFYRGVTPQLSSFHTSCVVRPQVWNWPSEVDYIILYLQIKAI